METYALTSFLINMLYLAVACAGLFYGLRLLDKLLKTPFGTAYENISTDPMALALYYGLRLLAIALLMAELLS